VKSKKALLDQRELENCEKPDKLRRRHIVGVSDQMRETVEEDPEDIGVYWFGRHDRSVSLEPKSRCWNSVPTKKHGSRPQHHRFDSVTVQVTDNDHALEEGDGLDNEDELEEGEILE
jgi:hypothetical protein